MAAIAALALLLGSAGTVQAAPLNPVEGSAGTAVTLTPPYPSSFTQIADGLALGSDGNAFAWGYGDSGDLGNGTFASSSTPVAVTMPSGTRFTQISKYGSSLAIGSDKKTYAWGENGNGQLGDGTTTNRSTPVEIMLPPEVTFAQVASGSQFSLAIGSDGKVYSWGANTTGNLGNGLDSGPDTVRPTAVSMPSGVTFTQVAAGLNHALAIDSDGVAYSWGSNEHGQLGDESKTLRNTPTPVKMPAEVSFTQIAAGAEFSLAIGSDGNAYSWGRNDQGQLGDSSVTDRSSPARVLLHRAATQVSAGVSHAHALASDGTAYGWGRNLPGSIGDDTKISRRFPTLVAMPDGVTFLKIADGGFNGFAIGDDGRGYSWGSNYSGQLGNGDPSGSGIATKPGPMSIPNVSVTSVTFDGVAGTSLTDLGTGSWKVTAPAHPLGPVNVVMNWTLGGAVQTPVTYVNGFTYTGPKVTITTRAYSDATRTTEIPKGSVLAPGTTIYWKYTVENTGAVPVSIQDLKRDTTALALPAACVVVELAVAATTSCTTQSTV